MTNIGVLRAAYDTQLRRVVPTCVPPGIRYELLGPVLRVVGRNRGFLETGPRVGMAGDELDALITLHRDFFAARGEAVEWKTRGHDEPADLTARLLAAGFVPEDRETVLVAEAGHLNIEPVLPAGVILRRAADRVDFDRIAAMQEQIWGEDHTWLADELESGVRDDPHDVLVFVAEANGLVVSSCRLEFVPGTEFAGLWGGSTLPDWRGRGIYRAMVAHRAGLAVSRGVRYLQVDASDESKPILLRLGFQAITTTTPYVFTPPTP